VRQAPWGDLDGGGWQTDSEKGRILTGFQPFLLTIFNFLTGYAGTWVVREAGYLQFKGDAVSTYDRAAQQLVTTSIIAETSLRRGKRGAESRPRGRVEMSYRESTFED